VTGPRKGHVARRTARRLAITVVVLVALLGLIGLMALLTSWALRHPDSWQAISGWLQALRPLFITVHLMLLAALWGRWAQLVRWGVRKGWVRPTLVWSLMAVRPRVVLMLAVLELVMVIRPYEWF
jgi:hypothetical protein